MKQWKMYCYKRCSTCKKAEKFMQKQDIALRVIDYSENPLSQTEIRQYYEQSGLDIKRFFNTSGRVYRALALKDKLPTLSLDAQIALLAEHPLLIKRPLLVSDDSVMIGFDEAVWLEKLNEK